ncbi:zf-HC2 domain-containing protein [Streptomyces sp. NPDC059008]|uniref:zf-HC2 domain-containing protein n=1 Tax=unclassified Streptomyces TaxID=2593676 RepID=UPI0036B0F11B
MHCSRIRTALSARLDGEQPPPGVTPGGLAAHLADCHDCRQWEARARALTARLDRATAHSEGDPAAVDALLAGLRSVSAGPVPPGAVDTDGGRAG